MRYLKWSALVFLSFLALGCKVDVPAPNDNLLSEYAPAEPALPQPKTERKAATTWSYGGSVAAVGPDWVEIGAGWCGSVEENPRTGRKWVRENGDTKKPKRISTANTKPGGDPKGEGKSLTHGVGDLKVGDIVSIDAQADQDGEEWTTYIRITRRPGGKIPPLRGDGIPEFKPPSLHLQDQAEQDWEEKGTPIPAKYLSNGRAPWTNPPYPPVAPMPRSPKP